MMKLPKFDYAKPNSISECCKLLEEHGAMALPIAGGTDLMMAMKNWLKTPKILVDLCGIPNLNQITDLENDGLRIGAMVTLRHLAQNPVVREKYPVLANAALAVGSTQVQAMGTIGGNLCQDNCCLYYNRSPMSRQAMGPCYKLDGDRCHAVKGSKHCWATYSGDLAPVLLALKASVRISDPQGETSIPAEQLYSGDGKQPHTLQFGRVITEIQVPAPPVNCGNAYLKMRVRKTIDYPLLGVAANVVMENDDMAIHDIVLALTAVEKAPLMIKAADELKGQILTDELLDGLAEAAYKQARPISNTYGYTPNYRKNMVRTYVKSAVRQSLERATGQGGVT